MVTQTRDGILVSGFWICLFGDLTVFLDFQCSLTPASVISAAAGRLARNRYLDGGRVTQSIDSCRSGLQRKTVLSTGLISIRRFMQVSFFLRYSTATLSDHVGAGRNRPQIASLITDPDTVFFPEQLIQKKLQPWNKDRDRAEGATSTPSCTDLDFNLLYKAVSERIQGNTWLVSGFIC